jgi:hypothetical protein
MLDLGEQERGEQAIARFIIRNDGGSELVIDRIGASCACCGLEREQGGRWWRLDRLEIAPHSQAEVAMRITVKGDIGSAQRSRAWFRTNDPDQPQAGLEALVSKIAGGFDVFPKSLLLGRVFVGTIERRTLEVRDRAVLPRRPSRVEITHPDQVAARLVPLDERDPPSNDSLGRLVDRIELTIDTSSPMAIDTNLLIHHHDGGRLPDRIRVTGEVSLPIEVSPRELLLPRESGTGLVYHGEIRLRSLLDESFEVSLEETPGELAVRMEHELKVPSELVMHVELRKTSNGNRGFKRLPISLAARIGNSTFPIKVVILCPER